MLNFASNFVNLYENSNQRNDIDLVLHGLIHHDRGHTIRILVKGFNVTKEGLSCITATIQQSHMHETQEIILVDRTQLTWYKVWKTIKRLYNKGNVSKSMSSNLATYLKYSNLFQIRLFGVLLKIDTSTLQSYKVDECGGQSFQRKTERKCPLPLQVYSIC